MKENEAIETLISIQRVSGYSKTREEALDMAIAALKKQGFPAADVVDVKHGKWMPHILTSGQSYYFCSICKEMVDIPTRFMIQRFHYCPYCGAKMDGGTNK